ncbi:hypothetical protein [Sphingomonas jaspsi]|uniref:hypothetical protein n=1 Tax=Sphingomonas jaspsi TaxID=392409 RepID=UPI0004B47DBA|nr:hypothetical protein [Sphingomonas jaspsi]
MRNFPVHFSLIEGRPTIWDQPTPASTPAHLHLNDDGSFVIAGDFGQDVRRKLGVRWTEALSTAAHDIIMTTTDNPDVKSRASEFAQLAVGTILMPHQVEYAHCLLQRLDLHDVRPAHAAFKKAWSDAQ